MRTARFLTVSQQALRIGEGVCPRGCLPRGGCPGGVPGVVCLVGVCPGGVSAQGGLPTSLWTEWQIGVKTLPCRNFVAGGKKKIRSKNKRQKSKKKFAFSFTRSEHNLNLKTCRGNPNSGFFSQTHTKLAILALKPTLYSNVFAFAVSFFICIKCEIWLREHKEDYISRFQTSLV